MSGYPHSAGLVTVPSLSHLALSRLGASAYQTETVSHSRGLDRRHYTSPPLLLYLDACGGWAGLKDLQRARSYWIPF